MHGHYRRKKALHVPDLIIPEKRPDTVVKQRMCGKKRVYTTYGEAQAAANRLRRDTGDKTEPYACHYCMSFHIGHIGPITLRRARV